MRPFGYEADKLTIREDEAARIRGAAREVLEHGTSLRQLVRNAESMGVRTVTGAPWSPLTIRRTLTSPRVAGLTTSGEEAAWPAILDRDTWEQVRKAVDATSTNHTGPPERRTYLLTGGIALCQLCGTPLVSAPSNSGKRGYVCRSGPPRNGCGKIRVAADGLEEHVAVQVLGRLAVGKNADKLRHLVETDAARLSELIAADEGWLTTLGADYADGRMTRQAFHEANRHISARIKANKKQLARALAAKDLPVYGDVDLAAWWNEASIERKRALIAVLVDNVYVGPSMTRGGNRQFEDSRVRIVWR